MKTIFTLFIACCFFTVSAQPVSQEQLKNKCFTLYRFMEKYHYKPVVWDDSSSALLFNKFISVLDENKLFFTSADMKLLEGFRYKLDEEVTGSQWSFLKTITPIYKQRLAQYDSIVTALLSNPLDYTKNESLQWPFTGYAAAGNDQKTRIQLYYKWRLSGALADSLADNKQSIIPGKMPDGFAAVEKYEREKLLKRVKQSAARFNEAKDFENRLAERFFNAISWVYDPHSDFMNMAEKEDFQSEVSAAEYTTGIEVDKNDKGECVIKYLIPGSPAWRSGELHAGDIVLKIKDNNGTVTEGADISEDEMNSLLSGGSTDKITVVIKNTAGTQNTISLEKEKVSTDENIVRSYILRGNAKIGYIQLPGFYSRFEADEDAKGCANDVAKEVIKLKRDTISGLILDLRNNGGGSMQEALELAGIFINEGPLCLIKDRSGKVTTLRDPNRGTIYDGPLMVLINGASASASELTSAVLQDYHRALIVGGNTYGKGTAQVVLPLDTTEIQNRNPASGDFEKVTGQKFYRVDGTTVQWRGVLPDINLPDPYQQDDLKERSEASALKPDTCKPSHFNAWPLMPVSDLQAKSASRVDTNSYFNSIKKFTSWISTADKPRLVPLKWDAFLVYYKSRTALYKDIGETAEGRKVFYNAENNSIDKERSGFMSAQSKELNANWLEELEEDIFLEEAVRIMHDWLGNRN